MSKRILVLERVASEIRSVLGPRVTRVAIDGVAQELCLRACQPQAAATIVINSDVLDAPYVVS